MCVRHVAISTLMQPYYRSQIIRTIFLSVHFRGHYKSFNIMLKYHYNHTYNLLNKLITQGWAGAVSSLQFRSVCLLRLKTLTEICPLSIMKAEQSLVNYLLKIVNQAIKYQWRQTIVFELWLSDVIRARTIGALDCLLQLYQSQPFLPSSTSWNWTLRNFCTQEKSRFLPKSTLAPIGKKQ